MKPSGRCWEACRAVTDQAQRDPSRRRRSPASEAPELARPLVPLARRLDIGLQADDPELGQLVGIVGAGGSNRTLRQARLGGALEELAGGKHVAALELLQALGVQAERALALGGVELGHHRHEPGTQLGSGLAALALAGGATISVVFASANTAPSTLTRLMATSDGPSTPTGRMRLRLGSAANGTAHAPGAIACPSDRATVEGRPRMRMKLFLASAS